jgi:hypothetical protein
MRRKSEKEKKVEGKNLIPPKKIHPDLFRSEYKSEFDLIFLKVKLVRIRLEIRD